MIHIALDPRLVDVNVHPRKAEVRLAQERAVYQALTRAVGEALASFPQQAEFAAWAWPVASWEQEELRETGPAYVVAGGVQALGQILNTYLIARSVEGLVVVDQHAAHLSTAPTLPKPHDPTAATAASAAARVRLPKNMHICRQ